MTDLTEARVPAAPVGPPRRRRGKRAAWAAIALVVLGAGAAVGFVVTRTPATQVLEARFASTSSPFETGTSDGCRYGVVDGRYVIAAQAAGALCSTTGDFSRHSTSTDVQTRVVTVVERSKHAAYGVGCFGDKARGGYLFLASRGNGYSIVRYDNGRFRSVADVADLGFTLASSTLRLSCAASGGAAVTLTGYVNGTKVIGGADAAGFADFSSAELVLLNAGKLGSATYDDVKATVPGR